jgi:tetratricopeptide (TPR) repeat protein
MPTKTYMVVDPRHDHSMRIPRPDLSVELETPNACNSCHEDKTPEWAAKQVKAWYGHAATGFQSYAKALHDARQNMPGAGVDLPAIIRDTEVPNIARATALSYVGPYLNPATVDVLTIGLSDSSPAVRVATVGVMETAPPDMRVQLVSRMLKDPVRAVRIEAARVLAPIPAGDLPEEQRVSLEKALEEHVASPQAMAERPEAQMNLGNLYAAQGESRAGLLAYETAIELNPVYVPAYVNLADFYRSQGNEAEAEKTLHRAVEVAPGNADVHHALGLLLVRQKRTDEAIEELRLASTLHLDNVRYLYVYAVALNSTGQPELAVMVLQGAHSAYPSNIEILRALVAFNRDLGNQSAARAYAEKLRSISP